MKNKIKKILFERPYSESIKILRQYLTGKFINLTVIKSLKDLESDRKQLIFYNKYIGKNKLIFDIGANIGDKTNLFLKLGCKVIAVEPQSDLANRLRIKYTNNKNVAVERCGIGKEDGEAEINISTKYPGFSSFIKTWQQGTKYHTFEKTEKVKITTLDKLISKYGIPYFCKIDVEGFEYEVLSGLSKKIPLII
jgi:FkbM family methyltransferase